MSHQEPELGLDRTKTATATQLHLHQGRGLPASQSLYTLKTCSPPKPTVFSRTISGCTAAISTFHEQGHCSRLLLKVPASDTYNKVSNTPHYT